MQRIIRKAAPLLLAVLVVPAIASAQDREFTGKVDMINDKKVIVDNRMGDKVTFVRIEETVVEGEKTAWGKVREDDWVTVSWKVTDKPRKAYRVVVAPPKEE